MPFETVTGIVTPLDRASVDTDQIVPKQFLKSVSKSGFGRHLFYDWRFDSEQKERPDFVLNDLRYRGSPILVTGQNFGCGSSREHAVWALYDYGFRVVVSPSFADIFYSNCFKNGLLPVKLEPGQVRDLMGQAGEVRVDLHEQTVTTPDRTYSFEIDPHRKKILLEGLDDIAMTLQFEDRISSFEKSSPVPSVL